MITFCWAIGIFVGLVVGWLSLLKDNPLRPHDYLDTFIITFMVTLMVAGGLFIILFIAGKLLFLL